MKKIFLVILLAAGFGTFAQNVKISALSAASTLSGTEKIPAVQSGSTVRTTAQDIANLSVKTVKVSISSAEILAGNTTPKVLVAAQGSGTFIQPLSIVTKYTFVTTQYATNTNIQYRYAGFSGNVASVNNGLGQTQNLLNRVLSTTGLSFLGASVPTNAALVFDVATGDPTGGDGTLDVYVSYIVISL